MGLESGHVSCGCRQVTRAGLSGDQVTVGVLTVQVQGYYNELWDRFMLLAPSGCSRSGVKIMFVFTLQLCDGRDVIQLIALDGEELFHQLL